MNKQKPETTHSGIKVEGNWEDICGFARDLEGILKESYERKDYAENMGDSIENYNDWRPREEEDEEDITKKTAEEASMEEKDVENDFKGTDEELKSAGKKVKDSISRATDEKRSATAELKEASKCINRLVGCKSIKSLRKMEKAIYEQVMLKFNPYYFDTEYFSVTLEEKNDYYLLTVNIPEEKLREKIKKGLKEEN